MRPSIILFIFIAIHPLNVCGQDTVGLAKKIDRYLTSANNTYHFNGAALVIYNGSVLVNKGYGFSNITTQTPNTPDTRFPLLSITKTFTATIILKLQDEKKLSVEDNLQKYFPDYPHGDKIKIHHLLTHSSGIYNYTDDVGEEDSALINYPIAKEKVVAYFKDKQLAFTPGKRYSYNNSGFFLLGLIIEKVTGKPYEDVVREYILNPLGMHESGFDFLHVPKSIRAQGYQFWNSNRIVPYKHYDSTYAYAAGSMYSTTSDMMKWAKAVSSKEILAPKTWADAFTPKINGYGYGWQTGNFLGKNYVKHSGGYPGYMTEFVYYPDENLTIVLLNNVGNYGQSVWPVGMGLSCIALHLPYDDWKPRKEISLDRSIMQTHVGTYRYEKSRIEIKLKDNKLFATVNGAFTLELHPEGENDFFFRDFNTAFHFDNNTLIIHEHGGDTKWVR